MSGKKLSESLKRNLIQNSIRKKLQNIEKTGQSRGSSLLSRYTRSIDEKFLHWKHHTGFQQVETIRKGSEQLGVSSPFFRVHQGIAGATSLINDQQMLNFSSYNYLDLNGHPLINEAAKQAIDRYGTSVSASRIVSGERPIHQQFERQIADCYGVDDALVYVSGHATNVSTIGYLFSSSDLIIHDEYIHNSSVMGSELSGAKRLLFPHNDLDALEKILLEQRHQFQRVLIIVEGLYSMDGDYPDLPRLIELKNTYKTFLMVDEAHSFGVLGKSGLGIREQFAVNGSEVDIWMGTLSKSLCAMGGFIAGESALIDNLRHLSPGFLYSVGLSAPIVAAASQALDLMQEEPERLEKLSAISGYFLNKAQTLGLNTGHAVGQAIIPVILGSSLLAGKASEFLFQHAINVQPILYPAVPEKNARLRFFMNAEHTREQVDHCLQLLADFLQNNA